MNNTVIIYYSAHHNNTKTLLDYLKTNANVDLLSIHDATAEKIQSYKRIGFASGIYMGDVHKSLYTFIDNLPINTFTDKHIVLIFTSGSGNKKYRNKFSDHLESKGLYLSDSFGCRGYDTYGLFKYIGGISKKHPNITDMEHLLSFYEKLDYLCIS